MSRTTFKKSAMKRNQGIAARSSRKARAAGMRNRARNVTRAAPANWQRQPGVAAARGNFMYGRGGSERKWLDTGLALGPIPTTGGITPSLNLIDSGTGPQERIGKRVTITSIAFRGQSFLNTTGTVVEMSDNVRIICYLDKQCNGAAPAVDDILQTASYYAFNNLENSDRFVTLWTRRITLNAKAFNSGGSAQYMVPIKHYYKCQIPIELKEAGTTAITDVKSYNIGVLYISASGYGRITGTFRVRFTDS